MLHKRIAVRRKMEILFMVRINIIKNVFYKIITKGF